jgi:hypothetical protein
MNNILQDTIENIEKTLVNIYEYNYPTLNMLKEMDITLPFALKSTVNFVLCDRLQKALENEHLEDEGIDEMVLQIQDWQVEINQSLFNYIVSGKINSIVAKLALDPEDEMLLKILKKYLWIASELSLELNLWQAEGVFFKVIRNYSQYKKFKEDIHFKEKKEWLDLYEKVACRLKINIGM